MVRGETLELEAGTDQEGEAPEELNDGAWELRRGEQSSTAMAETESGAALLQRPATLRRCGRRWRGGTGKRHLGFRQRPPPPPPSVLILQSTGGSQTHGRQARGGSHAGVLFPLVLLFAHAVKCTGGPSSVT